MDAQTSEIILPVTSTKVVVRDWITGADAEYITAAIHAGLKIRPNMGGSGVSTDTFDLSATFNEIHRSLEKFVVSVNGDTNDVVKKLLDLPEEDYDFVVGEVMDKRKKKKATEKALEATT